MEALSTARLLPVPGADHSIFCARQTSLEFREGDGTAPGRGRSAPDVGDDR